MTQKGTIPDQEFIVEFRMSIERYLCATDEWETAYRRCYMFPGYTAADLEVLQAHQREYQRCRCDLEAMLPRARQLCDRYQMNDPFDALLRVRIGDCEAAIGRETRAAVSKCFMELHAACRDSESGVPPERVRGSLVQRLVSYFS